MEKMKKVNKQCLLDTPRTVRFSEKTWQVIVQTSRPKFFFIFYFFLIWFFTSTQQSFSYAGWFFLGLTSTKLG